MSETPIRQALLLQAQACEALGSGFSASLLRAAADDLPAVEALFAPWAGADTRALFADAAPLRFLAALHQQVLSGSAPALARWYPVAGREGDAARAWTEARARIAEAEAALAAFMTHEPQTNETRRSLCLLGGFLTVAEETRLPLDIVELGASAGLNQFWDRYRYDLGPAGSWGDDASPVRLDTDWRGGAPPLGAPVQVVARAACDRKPVDLTDPAARLRLKSYIWPDQLERLARLDAAARLALEGGVRVQAMDAVDFAAAHGGPREGAAKVIFHSVFWQYMPAESQARLSGVIAGHGAAAGAASPFAWVRMEPAPANMAEMEIRLTLWPGGQDRPLGRCHPHGAWVIWEA